MNRTRPILIDRFWTSNTPVGDETPKLRVTAVDAKDKSDKENISGKAMHAAPPNIRPTKRYAQKKQKQTCSQWRSTSNSQQQKIFQRWSRSCLNRGQIDNALKQQKSSDTRTCSSNSPVMVYSFDSHLSKERKKGLFQHQ